VFQQRVELVVLSSSIPPRRSPPSRWSRSTTISCAYRSRSVAATERPRPCWRDAG